MDHGIPKIYGSENEPERRFCMKKVLALFLSISFLLTTFGLTAIAATTVPESLSDKLTIDYYGGDYEAEPFSCNIIENMTAITQRYTDQTTNFDIDTAPSELIGSTYIQTNCDKSGASTTYRTNNGGSWLKFTLKAPATVYYLTTGTYAGKSMQNFVNSWLSNGWSWIKEQDTGNPKEWTLNSNGGSTSWTKTRLFMLKKDIEASVENPVTIDAQTLGTENGVVYSFAIQWRDTSCDLSGITVGGSTLAGFAPGTTEYSDVEVASLETEITGIPADSSAQVIVKKPASLPGDATITVTKGDNTRIYTLRLIQMSLEPKVSNIKTEDSSQPNLISGFGVGTKRWSDYPILWEDMDGLTFDSDNCYYIQTAFHNAVMPDGYAQDKSEGWITFDINKSANVYILYGAGDWVGDPQYLPGLTDWEMLKKEDGTTPYTLKTADYDEKQTLYYHKYRRGYVFKKSFIVPGEGETKRTVSLTYGGTNALSTYNVIVEFADKANLTVTSTGNGTVSPVGTTEVIKGSTQTITATPADGWKISKITVNSVEQPIKESFSVTVDADTTVEVTFAELSETPPAIHTFDKTYVPDDKTNSVTFGTVAEGSKTTVKEYGIIYSATDSTDPQIGKENCYKLKAEKALSANGHYGIEIKGDLLLNTTYYTRTYVIYEKEDGTEAILYGEIKTIALQ